MYLKLNDEVVVVSGALKGQQGPVMRVDQVRNLVWIKGVNLRYKHIRRSQQHPKGGRVQKEAPIQVSNVQLIDPSTQKPTRVGFRFEGGNKIRFAKKSGTPL